MGARSDGYGHLVTHFGIGPKNTPCHPAALSSTSQMVVNGHFHDGAVVIRSVVATECVAHAVNTFLARRNEYSRHGALANSSCEVPVNGHQLVGRSRTFFDFQLCQYECMHKEQSPVPPLSFSD